MSMRVEKNKLSAGLILLLVCITSALLWGCRSEAPSYSTAEEFETALNSGSDVNGAMVTFTAGITEAGPNSYNMHAGKKLVFISSSHPNVNPGSTVTIKVLSVENVEGTWNIEYER